MEATWNARGNAFAASVPAQCSTSIVYNPNDHRCLDVAVVDGLGVGTLGIPYLVEPGTIYVPAAHGKVGR